MKRKRIRISGYAVFLKYPGEKSLWEDFWLSWKERPGRKKMRAAPCLCGLRDLKHNMLVGLHLLREHKDDPTWLEERREQCSIRKRLKTERIVIGDPKSNITEIWINEEWIGMDESIEMIEYYLDKVHGIKNPKLSWKRPNIIIGSA